ncbi:DUF4397 domain-containing protein [Pedobacter frigiditerrae]|uniref:DUF4397 domain-containing protein n=1 Tax=Pedobacter frigiditerrae TaxID=2530452 RepID=A0A4R0N2F9_9SPHI|nr:DUF4397 domain-containing protein [Pedobacter frigiditerrae]TCC94019.1 DUF4397 domain-containing protein [Pedobacter frigiditerrae]
MKKIIYLIFACVAILSACKKGKFVENTEYERLGVADPKYTYLKFLNVTPSSPTINFYIDGAKFTSGQSTSGVENAGYNYTTATSLYPDFGYAVTAPGSRKLTAKIIPSVTVDPSLEVLNTTITPAAGKYYTIFTSGVYSTTNKSVGPVLVVEDVRPALDTSKVFVRVINLYNGGPNVDLIRNSTGTKLVSNLPYGAASPFAEIGSPGVGVAPAVLYTLNNAATNTALASNVSYSFTKGRAYTIFLKGILGNATFPLTLTNYTTFYY